MTSAGRSRSRGARPYERGGVWACEEAGDNYQVLRAVAIGFRLALHVFRLRRELLQLLQLWLRLRLPFEACVHLNLVSCFHFEQSLLAKFSNQRQ